MLGESQGGPRSAVTKAISVQACRVPLRGDANSCHSSIFSQFIELWATWLLK